MANGAKHLRQELGILSVTSITAGIVIGAGVFVITGIAAKYAGSYTYVSYAIGAVPVLLVGLSTIMLNLMYPVEGGESYVYPTRVVSHYAGFLSGWASSIIGYDVFVKMIFNWFIILGNKTRILKIKSEITLLESSNLLLKQKILNKELLKQHEDGDIC